MSALAAMGNAPLVELASLNGKGNRVSILGKLEGNNPDALRVAQAMARGAILVILPDRGNRSARTTLSHSICGKCPL